MSGERDPLNEVVTQNPLNRWLVVLAVILVFGVLVSVAYVARQHDDIQQLTTANGQMQENLNRAHQELASLEAKLATLTAPPAAPTPAPVIAEPAATKAKAHRARRVVAKRAAPEDPRWKQFQDQLARHDKQLTETEQNLAKTEENLAKTRSDLEGTISSARTELGQGIARNHEELVALQKKGERNYFEFEIAKGKQYRHAGPLSISLRKTKTKQQFCDLALIVDDMPLTKKHVNLYEPVLFYPTGYAHPVEVVVNRIERDVIHGYVSEPKYRESELAAAGPRPASTNSSSAPSAAPPDPTTLSPVASDPAAAERAPAPTAP